MIINDEMYNNLSELFYAFDNSQASNVCDLRKRFKFLYESLVEQTFSHVYGKDFRNLTTTLRTINVSKVKIDKKYQKIVKALRESLTTKYPLSNKTYTDDNGEIIDFVVNFMIPFILEIISLDTTKNANKEALMYFLTTIKHNWGNDE
ncbi:hypothetical protein SNN53_002410 [Cronobacter sakazakii]|uniref:hypothetical protein n=1 Tax=Cronobacter sakazakii TaxID=28141 RepID=UPI000CF0F070|nr:hypothetical protein [Cronobacter sakazakii]EJQ2087621.1 hypothetical protein [Cronobacter sakazakii]EJR9311239.1 hypothetical protein [Cronobacter sakazakii]EJR9315864.1 hypothetical protein [Cronobacter sakazakii]EJR9320396.1 hypothetical protein [Cronobacter sakazakii]EJR9407852.1 hypothetical protein [Cronobacter sakazakii]